MPERGVRGVHPFVAFLAARRADLRWSMRDVFIKGGPKQPTLSKLENGVQQPTAYTLDQLARVFGFRLALVDGKGNVYEFDEPAFEDVE